MEDAADTRPILIVPYMWIGDFVRGHTVVRVLKQRWPNRPVDLLVTSLCAPLVDYMPGVRAGIVWDLPRSRLARGQAVGSGSRAARPGLWNRPRPAPHLEGGDCARAGRDPGAGGLFRRGAIRADQPDALGREGPAPLHRQECRAGAARRRAAAAGMAGAAARRAAGGNRALAAGQRPRHRPRGGAGARARSAPPSAGPITPAPRGCWSSAGSTSGWSAAPARRRWRRRSSPPAGGKVRDLTGTDLRNGILAMAAAGVAISNDSGLMHIAAAIGTPTMGIFGPTSPYLWAPLNGLAATVLQTKAVLPCQPCQRTVCTMNDHRCMRDIDRPPYGGRAIGARACSVELTARAYDRPRRSRSLPHRG